MYFNLFFRIFFKLQLNENNKKSYKSLIKITKAPNKMTKTYTTNKMKTENAYKSKLKY